jgi:hypothetical protein
MVKATLRSAVLLSSALALGATPSFAEVQNVRVGGDVTVRGFHRQNMDLNDSDDNGVQDSHDDFFMTTAGINVGADLTENVSAFVRLANERDWNDHSASTAVGDIDISQAYITMKELFYSPITLRLGTQPIVWGRGFVVGSNLLPSIAGIGTAAADRNASITPNEFTDFTAFDAIRASVDLSNLAGAGMPLSLDYIYIKMDENSTGEPDDVNLQGVNFGAQFEDLGAEVETYYLNKRDKAETSSNDGSVNTIGLRGSIKPVDGAYIYGEAAWQFGRTATDSDLVRAAGERQQAWAFDLGAEYTLTDVAMTPKAGLEWIFWSGKDHDGAVGGWDPLARGYYTTAIREFQTGANGGFYPTPQAGDTAGATNQHQVAFYGGLKPLEDLSVSPRLTLFFTDVGTIPVAGAKRQSFIGTELDTQVLYNYTEDVQLGLLYGVFKAGDVYRHPNDRTAQEIITTVGVKF